MSDEKKRSSYQKAINRIAILENTIKDLLEYLETTPVVAKQYISLGQVSEIKLMLIQALQRSHNL